MYDLDRHSVPENLKDRVIELLAQIDLGRVPLTDGTYAEPRKPVQADKAEEAIISSSLISRALDEENSNPRGWSQEDNQDVEPGPIDYPSQVYGETPDLDFSEAQSAWRENKRFRKDGVTYRRNSFEERVERVAAPSKEKVAAPAKPKPPSSVVSSINITCSE